MLLAGDIGGTKTHLALFAPEQSLREPASEATFPSKDYGSLEAIIQEFMAQNQANVDRAAFGVAGPVVNGQAATTNLPWIIRETRLQELLGTPAVRLLNDLQAIANAVSYLEPADLHTLNACEPEPDGTIAVIAPGTGLGEAFLVWNGQRYRAYDSEGGHCDFAPTDVLELGLLRYMMERLDHVSYEWVCSGRGIPNIYAYLKDSGYAPEPPWLAQQLLAAADPTPVIVNAALNHEQQRCELCADTLDIFVSILGAEAGNLALKVMATGGVFLAGGIPPRILPALEHQRFMQSFLDKGRLSRVLISTPVHVVTNRSVALMGSVRFASEL